MNIMRVAAIGVVIAALGACESTGTNKILGAGAGAAVGAGLCKLSSANDTECALLLAGGALAGYAVANYIDDRDKQAYREATNDVLVGNQASATRTSKETGNEVTVTRAAYEASDDRDCTVLKVNYQGTLRDETYCKGADGKMVPV